MKLSDRPRRREMRDEWLQCRNNGNKTEEKFIKIEFD
jgi:hypothetical protein